MPRVPRLRCYRASQSIGVALAKAPKIAAPTCDVRTFLTGIKVTAEGDPDRLLDFAFRAMIMVENGIGWLDTLSREVP